MLSYQHIYHAGNFADVHKHAVLIALIAALKEKGASLAVIDTHAGRGVYDLDAAEAGKTAEYAHGIGPLWQSGGALLPEYIEAVQRYNSGSTLRFYPGSAAIARDMLGAGDSLTCLEKHPGEFDHLQKALKGNSPCKVQMLHADGFTALKNIAPVKDAQGLAIIDPSYEIKNEYEALPKMLRMGWEKWPDACYLVWYPIMEAGGDAKLLDGLLESGIPNILISEVHLEQLPREHYRLLGSGLAIVNPPFEDVFLTGLTEDIAKTLSLKAQVMTGWL